MSDDTLPSFLTYLNSLQECAVEADWECIICSGRAPETDEPENDAEIPEVGDYPVMTTCGHIFHLRCLYKWTVEPRENRDGCPICRTKLFGAIHQSDMVDFEREAKERVAVESSEDGISEDSDYAEKRDDDKRLADVMDAVKELEDKFAEHSEWRGERIYAYAREKLGDKLYYPEELEGRRLSLKYRLDWPTIIGKIMSKIYQKRDRSDSAEFKKLVDDADVWIQASLAVAVVKHCFRDDDWLYRPAMIELQKYFLSLRDVYMATYC